MHSIIWSSDAPIQSYHRQISWNAAELESVVSGANMLEDSLEVDNRLLSNSQPGAATAEPDVDQSLDVADSRK